jgi:hypothetical protein
VARGQVAAVIEAPREAGEAGGLEAFACLGEVARGEEAAPPLTLPPATLQLRSPLLLEWRPPSALSRNPKCLSCARYGSQRARSRAAAGGQELWAFPCFLAAPWLAQRPRLLLQRAREALGLPLASASALPLPLAPAQGGACAPRAAVACTVAVGCGVTEIMSTLCETQGASEVGRPVLTGQSSSLPPY